MAKKLNLKNDKLLNLTDVNVLQNIKIFKLSVIRFEPTCPTCMAIENAAIVMLLDSEIMYFR